jgi:PAS domain S-box-containing protein
VETDSEHLHTLILRDISGRLAAQQEIREREALFRSFFEASSVGAAVLDKEGRFVAVNDCYINMLGYSREELLAGLGPLDLTHPDDLPTDRERVKRLRHGETYDHEKRFVSKQGKTVWAHVSAQVVFDRAGKVESIIGVIQDITQRRQAAEAMRNYQLRLETEVEERTRELTSARNYFRDFIVRAPIPLCVSDADGRIAIRNEKFISLFGYDDHTAPTIDAWWELAYPDPAYRAWAMASWQASVDDAEREQRAITPVEYRVRCADGSERQVEISGVALEMHMAACRCRVAGPW